MWKQPCSHLNSRCKFLMQVVKTSVNWWWVLKISNLWNILKPPLDFFDPAIRLVQGLAESIRSGGIIFQILKKDQHRRGSKLGEGLIHLIHRRNVKFSSSSRGSWKSQNSWEVFWNPPPGLSWKIHSNTQSNKFKESKYLLLNVFLNKTDFYWSNIT